MIHGNKIRKFGRERNQRNALLRSLAESLVLKGKIKTTDTKAKSLRPFTEKLVTLGKGKSVASERLISSRIGARGATKIVKEIAPKYGDRKGGYLRITKLPGRSGDATRMAVIEFV